MSLRIDILTLFPGMFAPLKESIIKRAGEKGIVDINVINIRDFAFNKHRMVDDLVYGGGAGMVMKPEPIYEAVQHIKSSAAKAMPPRIIITSPQGESSGLSITLEAMICAVLLSYAKMLSYFSSLII